MGGDGIKDWEFPGRGEGRGIRGIGGVLRITGMYRFPAAAGVPWEGWEVWRAGKKEGGG